MGDHAYKIASHVRGLWNSHMVRAGLETARDMFMWPSDRPTPIESDRSYTYIYILVIVTSELNTIYQNFV